MGGADTQKNSSSERDNAEKVLRCHGSIVTLLTGQRIVAHNKNESAREEARATQNARENEDSLGATRRTAFCVKSKMFVTQAAQEERQGDSRDWMLARVQENKDVTRTIAECEVVYSGGGSRWV